MQQQNNRSIGRACLPIEEIEPVDLHRTVMRWGAVAESSGGRGDVRRRIGAPPVCAGAECVAVNAARQAAVRDRRAK